jgi:ABC-type Zn2+ transport system substrate-binding protein/surface adhesin
MATMSTTLSKTDVAVADVAGDGLVEGILQAPHEQPDREGDQSAGHYPEHEGADDLQREECHDGDCGPNHLLWIHGDRSSSVLCACSDQPGSVSRSGIQAEQ